MAGTHWDSVTINADTPRVLNPDDPDGDLVEVVAWWEPGLLRANPAVRRELAATLDLALPVIEAAGHIGDEVGKAAEAAAWRTYLRNVKRGDRRYRPFAFAHHPDYIGQAANSLAAVGDYAAAAVVLDIT